MSVVYLSIDGRQRISHDNGFLMIEETKRDTANAFLHWRMGKWKLVLFGCRCIWAALKWW